MKAALGGMPNFYYCLSPSCDSGQIHDGGADAPILRCNKCGFKSCVVHNRKWHEGLTCGEYDLQSHQAIDEEQASLAEVHRIAKACPGCNRMIQKHGGCKHMTCIVCKFEFCWTCSADYTKIRDSGNDEHDEACPYHTANLPDLDGANFEEESEGCESGEDDLDEGECEGEGETENQSDDEAISGDDNSNVDGLERFPSPG
jgi:hypothetical protein